MMAPTEVLARQYAQSLGPLLDAAGVTWEVLTGSTPARERGAIVERAAAGTIDVLFGTHALLEDDVTVAALLAGGHRRAAAFRRRAARGAREQGARPGRAEHDRHAHPANAGAGGLRLIHAFVHHGAAEEPRREHDAGAGPLPSGGGVRRGARSAAGRAAGVRVCPLVGQTAREKDEKAPSRARSEEDAYEYGAIVIEGDDAPAEDLKAATAQARFLQAKVFPTLPWTCCTARCRERRRTRPCAVSATGRRACSSHHLYRGGRRRFQRHGHDRGGRGPLWPGAAPPAARSRGARRAPRPGVPRVGVEGPGGARALAVMERTEDGFAVARARLGAASRGRYPGQPPARRLGAQARERRA